MEHTGKTRPSEPPQIQQKLNPKYTKHPPISFVISENSKQFPNYETLRASPQFRVKKIKTLAKSPSSNPSSSPSTHKSGLSSPKNGDTIVIDPKSRNVPRSPAVSKERKDVKQSEAVKELDRTDSTTKKDTEAEILENLFNPVTTAASATTNNPPPKVAVKPTTLKGNHPSTLTSTQFANNASRRTSFRKRPSTSNHFSRRKTRTPEEHSALCRKSLLNHGSDLLIQIEQLLLDGTEIEAENRQPEKTLSSVQEEYSSNSHEKSKIESSSLPSTVINWMDGSQSVSIRNCAAQLFQKPFKQSSEILSSVSFSLLAKFKNIFMVLSLSSNITTLEFSSVVLLRKPREKPPGPPSIDLPHLRSLVIVHWFFSLTPNEYWLMDLMSKSLTAPNLKSLTFHGTNASFQDRIVQDSQAKLNQSQALISSFLERMPTVQNLSLGGLGFKSEKPLNFSGVQPVCLRLDLSIDGVEELLKAVKRIESLIISGCLGSNAGGKVKAVVTCAESNSRSLRILKIFTWFSSKKETGQNAIKLYNFDCEVLRNCLELECLYVNVGIASARLRVPCGKIYNVHCLYPEKLSRLELYNEEFRSEELSLLGKKLPEFVNLKYLGLSGNNHPQCLYEIPLHFVKCICEELKQFKEGYFFGGKFENVMEVKKFFVAERDVETGFDFKIMDDYVFICRQHV